MKSGNSNPHLIRQAEAIIPTPWGNFNMIAYAAEAGDWMPHLALVHEKAQVDKPVLVRLHSECITGDLFGSKRCDCGDQLVRALEMAAEEGGMVIYLRQEGRGIGIINKLKAYQLQDKGLNTIDANVHLGLEIDARHYEDAICILHDLNIRTIRLLTNNPEKVEAFEQSAIKVVERVPIIIHPNKDNEAYLRVKKEQMGHWF